MTSFEGKVVIVTGVPSSQRLNEAAVFAERGAAVTMRDLLRED
jgi:NAD(P)-dependent dehydrogenase (short-subunit alcohol dehydrogenase family)